METNGLDRPIGELIGNSTSPIAPLRLGPYLGKASRLSAGQRKLPSSRNEAMRKHEEKGRKAEVLHVVVLISQLVWVVLDIGLRLSG